MSRRTLVSNSSTGLYLRRGRALLLLIRSAANSSFTLMPTIQTLNMARARGQARTDYGWPARCLLLRAFWFIAQQTHLAVGIWNWLTLGMCAPTPREQARLSFVIAC